MKLMRFAFVAALAALACVSAAPAFAGDWSVGASAGASSAHGGDVGLSLIRHTGSAISLEATYDRGFAVTDAPKTVAGVIKSVQADRLSDAASVNVVLTPFSGKLQPYVLAGVGYRMSSGARDEGTWTAGAGATYQLFGPVSLDARYRYSTGLASRASTSTGTLGLSVRF